MCDDSEEVSYLRGHRIKEVGGEWIYCDTGEPTVDTWQDRPCGKCGLPFTEDGHDGCLGELPNVVNACCGHGCAGEAYVQFEDGTELREASALAYMEPFR